MEDTKQDAVPENENKAKVDPAELYNPSTRLPKKRDMVVQRPGNINYAAPGGSFPGSRIVEFTPFDVFGLEEEDYNKLHEQVGQDENGPSKPLRAVEWLNLYFKHRANLLTTNVQVSSDGNSIFVIFTNHLEGGKLEYFQKYQSVVADTMQKWEDEQAAKAEEEAKTAEARRKETESLIELGKKARDHNLITKLKELADEVDELRKKNAKLEKAAKK
jgi:hypothetical protein